MKIKFIVNDGMKNLVKDDIERAIAYFGEKTPLDFEYDIQEVNLRITHTLFFQSEYDKKYWMGTYKVKEQLRPIVPENEYHAVVFIYDRSKSVFYGKPNFEVASWSFHKPIYQRTEYTEVATDASLDAQNWTWKLIAHEIVHAFTKRVKRAGRTILDEMDVTTVKGKKTFYYMNHNPEHKDGNYARTLKNLEKHWDMVEYFPEMNGKEEDLNIIHETGTYKNLVNKRPNNKPEQIIVHHTGGTDADPLADTSHHTAKIIETWHLQKGWDGLGYHFVIEKSGKIYAGRPEHINGAHAKGHNTKSLGICLAGNFDLTLPTKEQEQSLRFLLAEMSEKYKISRDNIFPHRTFANKTCYGKKLGDDWGRNLLPETVVIENSDAVIDFECSCKELSEYTYTDIFNEMVRRLKNK